ncbi:MAG: glycosyltransferase family 39 protein [Anaerolineales bacterium]|nr:glycosyltransferase family 39 protein [Anaerolineales bacterium]MCB9126968.1 glycosyltransferase family 39 protein [Ardenticatenales bacterium]MCB9171521.1 glycosyltransferase family 39 protein [Ardenticatenales bacterium]
MTSPSTSAVDRPRGPSLSLESALWLFLALLALLWRCADLGGGPLATVEAAHSLAAYHWIHGQPYDLTTALLSPLAVNLNALSFAVLGDSDGVARLVSAVAGVGLVLSPWLMRHIWGRAEMLGAALLLLISPAVTFFSRYNSGDILAALCALLLLSGIVRWQRSGAGRDALLAAVALGVGLTSGAGFWSLLTAGALFWLWQRRRGRVVPLPSSRQLWLVVALTFLVASSGLFFNPPGIGAAFALPVAWLRALLGLGVAGLALPFFLTFLLYELLLVACLILMIRAMAERFPPWTTFLLIWAAVTLIPATLANSGWNGALLWVALPLALLGGGAWLRLLAAFRGDMRAISLTALAALLILGYLVIILPTLFDGGGLDVVRLLVAPVIVLVLFLAAENFYGREVALSASLLGLLLMLAVLAVDNGWGAAMVRSDDPREPLVVAPTHPDMRRVAREITALSVDRYRDQTAIPVEIDPSFRAGVRWYLRSFNNGAPTPSAGQAAQVALRPPTSPVPEGFIGERFFSGASWSWATLPSNERLRWLATREGRNVPAIYQEGRLYVRLEEGS